MAQSSINSSELISTVNELAKERRVNKDVLFSAIEAALISAYKKNYGRNANVRATIDRAREKYRLQLELSAYTPRTWRVLWIFKRKYNRAAAKIIDEVQAEVEAFFSGLALPGNIASALHPKRWRRMAA